MKYSCIIPVYNEQTRISNVLEQVVRIGKISEIICVDDGSTDNSVCIISEKFPQVKLVKHKHNLGKTAAIVTGLESVKTENILLLDSDLVNLKADEIDNAINSFERNNLDCLLFNTAPMNCIDQLIRHVFRFLLLAAGNRIISKQCLVETLKSGNFKNYHLEIAQNKFLMESNKKVAYLDISAKDVSKIDKIGFFKGWLDEIAMWWQIISYAGLVFFIKQSLFFCKKKVS